MKQAFFTLGFVALGKFLTGWTWQLWVIAGLILLFDFLYAKAMVKQNAELEAFKIFMQGKDKK